MMAHAETDAWYSVVRTGGSKVSGSDTAVPAPLSTYKDMEVREKRWL